MGINYFKMNVIIKTTNINILSKNKYNMILSNQK